jgi:CheY-like chemotaxis protein
MPDHPPTQHTDGSGRFDCGSPPAQVNLGETAGTQVEAAIEKGLALVADDEIGVRQLATHVLESLGFRVLQAEDGLEALAHFQQHAAALRLGLLDLSMPRLDGAQAFAEMHRARPDLPVILMSGYSEGELIARFAKLGLAGFLPKPFNVDGLIAKVKAVLTGV